MHGYRGSTTLLKGMIPYTERPMDMLGFEEISKEYQWILKDMHIWIYKDKTGISIDIIVYDNISLYMIVYHCI